MLVSLIDSSFTCFLLLSPSESGSLPVSDEVESNFGRFNDRFKFSSDLSSTGFVVDNRGFELDTEITASGKTVFKSRRRI